MITALINDIEQFLIAVHNSADEWFDKAENLRQFRPQNQGWTIDEILEHIVLTSYFLLVLIEKGGDKALRNIQNRDLAAELENYTFHRDRLDEIGIHKSFNWFRPEHMAPKGEKSLSEIRTELKEQLQKCQEHLAKMSHGEGVLYKMTMSVNDLGKIDVYEYIYFLGKHIERHIAQMCRNETEFYV